MLSSAINLVLLITLATLLYKQFSIGNYHKYQLFYAEILVLLTLSIGSVIKDTASRSLFVV